MRTRFEKQVRAGMANLLTLTVLCAGCQTAPVKPSLPVFRVMTYNVHHGEGIDHRVDLERIAQLIKRERADIVALQEVDKGVERTGRRNLAAELGALTGMSFVFSNNYSFQGGEYGNAILSRFPVKRSGNLHYKKVEESEQRGLLEVTLDIHGRELLFLATHLDHRPPDAARWSNVGEIEERMKSRRGAPVILSGDFNTQPSSRVYQRLNQTFEDTWVLAGDGSGFTIPSENPSRRIDYIWISRDKSLSALKAWVPNSQASDHRPIVVELRLNR